MLKFKNWTGVAINMMLLLLTVAGCNSSPEPTATPEPTEVVAEVTLLISGSGGAVSILQAIEPLFEADTPGYRLETLSGTGTDGGVRGVMEGQLDVAAMGRAPKEEETVEYVEFGQTGQAIFVHPDVGVNSLTTEQVAAVFSGEITNWSEVGGPDQEIILYVRDEGDASTKALRGAIFGDTPFPETAQVLTSQGDMVTAVEETPGAAGFGTWPAVRALNAKLDAIALDGVAPGDPGYPITNPVGIGYSTERQADVQPLIDWLLSEEGIAALQEIDVITQQ